MQYTTTHQPQPATTTPPAQVVSLRQARHVLAHHQFLLDHNGAVYTLAKHQDVPQEGGSRWLVCVATNGPAEGIGTIIEVRATTLVRLVKQTRVGQYEEL